MLGSEVMMTECTDGRVLYRCISMSVIFTVILTFLSHLSHGEEPVSCTAVLRDPMALITCFFPRDLNASKSEFNIEKYHFNQTIGDSYRILSCSWDEKGELWCVYKLNDSSVSRPISTQVTLNISKFTFDDEAYYICAMVPPGSSELKPCWLPIGGPPEPPQNVTFVTSTESTVTIRWTAGDSGRLPPTFRVRYKRTSGPPNRYKYEDVDSNDTMYTIEQLFPGTEYVIGVMAYNARGPSEYQDTRANTSGTTDKPAEALSGGAIAGIVVSILTVAVIVAVIIYKRTA